MNWPAETALERITEQLQEDGVAAFSRAFDSLLSSVEGKCQQLASTWDTRRQPVIA